MDVDNWSELVDWESYQDESKVLQLIEDIDLEAEHHGDDRRIFRLEDFFVYDEKNTSLLPLDFDKLDNLYIAGKAIPIFPDNNDDDTDAEDESGAFESNIRLSSIQKVEYTYLDVSSASYDGVYILTSFAWYLLQKPANFYLNMYKEPYRQFRLALTILRRAYEVPEERLSSFVTRFRRLAARVDRKYTKALAWGYPELRPTDLQQSSSIIARNIMFFINHLKVELESTTDSVYRNNLVDVHTRLTQSRTVEKVLNGHLATIRRRDDNQATPPSSPPPNTREVIEITDDSSDEEMEDRRSGGRAKPGRRTCVTPIVERTARTVFSHPLNLIGEALPNVSWRNSRCRGTAVAEDIRMKRGQCIMVPAGIDELLPHEDWAFNHAKTESVNEAANEYWFAQVISTTQDGKRLHVRWFDHSSKTALLGGLERPMELFLTQRCDYVHRYHVKRVVEVKWFGPDQELPSYEENYYVRFVRELDGSFTWANQEDLQLDPTPSTSCRVCDKAVSDGIRFEHNSLRINNVELHKGDFIVTQPMTTAPWFAPGVSDMTQHRSTTPGQIFQIMSVLRSEQHGRDYLVGVTLRPLERVDALRTQRLVSAAHSSCPGRPKRDERRLCLMDEWSSQLELETLKKHPIRKCFVRHPDMFESSEAMNEWLASSPTHFIVDVRALPGTPANPMGNRRVLDQPAITVNSLSLEAFQELARPCRRCRDELSGSRVTKLRTLDLFCGAGGLTQGLVESGICEPTYAVDHDMAALETYKQNFPGATTIHQDVNIALSETLIAALNECDRAPFPDDIEDPEPLPSRYDVDFICGGPPCQSFSGANRFKKDNDPRTTMIVATMSAVGHYRPKYFLIENVPNALTSKILGPVLRAGSADSADSADNPANYIEQGVLRFISRVSLDLGYAFRVGVLQAAEYGAPQLRRRAFIIGARHGYTLPNFPLATHCVPRPETGLRLPSGTYIDPIREKSGNAIHRQATMWDAIGDLAPFEWANPHVVIRQTESARADERLRQTRLHIPAYVAVREDRLPVGIGARGAVPYREGSPFTTYQLEARGKELMVSEHYTSSFKSSVFVERVVSIPISARADHRSLPEVLRKDDFLSNIFGSGGASGYYRGAFGRYDKKSLFATILTSLRPAKKNGLCIHPEQKRMLTMRELARAQGFPDCFRFHGTVEQVNRQIGNAVVVQVARAIGMEIKRAMLKDGVL